MNLYVSIRTYPISTHENFTNLELLILFAYTHINGYIYRPERTNNYSRGSP